MLNKTTPKGVQTSANTPPSDQKQHGRWCRFKSTKFIKTITGCFCCCCCRENKPVVKKSEVKKSETKKPESKKTDTNKPVSLKQSLPSVCCHSYPRTQTFGSKDITMARFGPQIGSQVTYDKYHPILRGLDPKIDKKLYPSIVDLSPIVGSNDIILGPYLGGGSFGIVLSAKMKGKDVVLKLDTLAVCDMGVVVDRMSQLRHRNIIKVYKLSVNPPNIMIMEVGICDLWDYTAGKSTPLTYKQTQRFSRHIISGVKYLHSNGWSHNDMKLENVVLCKHKNNRLTAKIVDFDFMKSIYSDQVNKVLATGKAMHHTPEYSAPEVHKGSIIDDLTKPDIYAIGVTIYLMVTLHWPYKTCDYDSVTEVNNKIQFLFDAYDSGALFRNVPNVPPNSNTKGLLRVLKRLLNPYVDKRESLEVISRDKYFKTKIKNI